MYIVSNYHTSEDKDVFITQKPLLRISQSVSLSRCPQLPVLSPSLEPLTHLAYSRASQKCFHVLCYFTQQNVCVTIHVVA